jgi:hypothetical protein
VSTHDTPICISKMPYLSSCCLEQDGGVGAKAGAQALVQLLPQPLAVLGVPHPVPHDTLGLMAPELQQLVLVVGERFAGLGVWRSGVAKSGLQRRGGPLGWMLKVLRARSTLSISKGAILPPIRAYNFSGTLKATLQALADPPA